MSSSVALSTPRDHLNNIEVTLKSCAQLAASAGASFGPAAQDSPLGSVLTVMGQRSLPLLEEKEGMQERIRNGIYVASRPVLGIRTIINSTISAIL